MPIINAKEVEYITASIRLEKSVAEDVELYAQFVSGSPDLVASESIKHTLALDKEFQTYRKSTPNLKPSARRLTVQGRRRGANYDETTPEHADIKPRPKAVASA